MKKICIVLTIMLLLVGCDNSSNKRYTQEDLGIYDVQSQQLITLGSTRENIEKYIGSAQNERSFMDTTYCGYGETVYKNVSISNERELEIEYNVNNIAICFTLNSCWNEEDNRFRLPTDVGVLSRVNEFQEKYPHYTENKLNGLNAYSSEIHLQKDNDVFKVDNFTEDDYLKFKREYINKAISKDNSIGTSTEKSSDLLFHINQQWAYIIAEYDDYTEIKTIKMGYGWN
ncbi:MAG: hypothetical protein IKB55_04275 [Clostridia bacterium]|nr:hypothetical protein [Clostridia bacterium]